MKTIAIVAGLILLGTLAPLQAQQAPAAAGQTATIKRTPLQKYDVPGGGNYENVIGIAELPPNVPIGKHNHPGTEGGYLISGELTLMVDGQPPKQMKVGDSWNIGPGVPHDATAGAQGAKVIVTYTVEKGKPLASPA